MSTPHTALHAQMRYAIDVSARVLEVRDRLVKACRRDRSLRPAEKVLRGDLLESVVFQRVCQWLEEKPQPDLPTDKDVRRQVIYQMSCELNRQRCGHLVTPLAKACQASSAS